MATTGIVNGTLLTLQNGGVVIGGTTSHSLSNSMETRDATTKSSSGNEEVLEGLKSREVGFEGFVAWDEANGFEELEAILEARTQQTLILSTEVVGDPRWTYTAYLTSIDLEAGVEDSITYSGTFKITGSRTVATVT